MTMSRSARWRRWATWPSSPRIGPPSLADADLLEWISRLARDQVRSEGGALTDLRLFTTYAAPDVHACLC